MLVDKENDPRTPGYASAAAPCRVAAQTGQSQGIFFFLDRLSRKFRRRAAAVGLRTIPAFAGTYEFADKRRFFPGLFPRFLEGLPDGGVW